MSPELQMLLLFVVSAMTSGAVGSWVGLLVASRLAGKIVKRHLPDFPELIVTPSV